MKMPKMPKKRAPGAHSSLGLPCDMSSCWKNPASPRVLDQNALLPKSRRTPRLRRDGMAGEQYYALCVEEDDGSTEIAFFKLGREALPGALGISLYTSPDGELQRRHLQGNDHVVIAAKSPRDLLEALNTGVPNSVFV